MKLKLPKKEEFLVYKELICEEDKDFLEEAVILGHDGMKTVHHWNMDRTLFFTMFPKGGKVVEVGVSFGKNAYRINKIMEPEELVLVDPWEKCFKTGIDSPARIEESQRSEQNVRNCFESMEHVKIIKDFSVDAALVWDDNYFDFAYIDGDHSYESVIEDLYTWSKKVKPFGYIAGHDYSTAPTNEVRKALEKFLENNDGWEIVYLPPPGLWQSDSSDGHYDFAIQRVK